MAITSKFKHLLNECLGLVNLRIETRTAELSERLRLLNLERTGHFVQPVVPLLPQIARCDPKPVLEALERFREQTSRFDRSRSDGRYSFSNDYFTSPDAEVAYVLVRLLEPHRLIEVGSGNSTLLFREAIQDGELSTELVSIDPLPRRAIEAAADRVIQRRLENVPAPEISDALDANDILFIDSSHDVRIGNDVVELFLRIVPNLKKGVIVHIHDIFLPFEYPRQWIIENKWTLNEQYLVQAMLQDSERFEVIWPGHYLQRILPGFADYFTGASLGTATSLWLRKVG